MKSESVDALGTAGARLVDQFLRTRPVVAFDFDGTLAPIVAVPDRAAIPSGTRTLVASVARMFPCGIISGRGLKDLRPRVEGLGIWDVIGNHGLEPWFATEEGTQTIAAWRARLAPEIAMIPGAWIEDKTFSLAVHYRECASRAEARARIATAVDALDGRVIGGKSVINVMPKNSPNKGTALARLCRTLARETAVFVGDDDTDEDAFAVEGISVLGIRIGASETTRARLCLGSQEDVDSLLSMLVAFGSRK